MIPNKYGVHSLDFLGEKFSLTYKTVNGKLQTNFGGYLTIFLGVATALVCVVIFSQLFNTQAPVVTTSLEFGSKFAKYNLIDEDIVFPLAFVYQGRPITNLSKYFTLRVAARYFRQNKTTGQLEQGNSHVFNFITCDKVQDSKLKSLVSKFDQGLSLSSVAHCPDLGQHKEKYSAMYDEENVDHTSLRLYVYPCSLPDPSQCAPKEEIDQIEMSYSVMNKFFVSSDKKNPKRELSRQATARIGSLMTKYQDFELKSNRLVDDTSVLTSPRVTEEFASADVISIDSGMRAEQLHCPASIIDGPRSFLCAPYLRFKFTASGKTQVMSRSYKGAITVMGEFGGVIKILTAVVFMLYSFYSAGKMKSYFSSKIFKLNETQLKRLEGILAREEEFSQRENKGAKNGNKKSEKKKSEMRRMMEECVQSKFNAADMMYKLSMLEVLEDILFEEHDKTLLPLVIMKRYKNKLKEQNEKNENKFTKRSKGNLSKKRKSVSIDYSEDIFPQKFNQKNKETENQLSQKLAKRRQPLKRSSSVLKKRFSRSISSKNAKNQHETFKKTETQQLGSQPQLSIQHPEANQNHLQNNLKIKNKKSIQSMKDEEIGVSHQSLESEKIQISDEEEAGSDFEKAYKDLLSSSPRIEIKRAIRSYMLQNVREYFEGPKRARKNSSKMRAFMKKRTPSNQIRPSGGAYNHETKPLNINKQRVPKPHQGPIYEQEEEEFSQTGSPAIDCENEPEPKKIFDEIEPSIRSIALNKPPGKSSSTASPPETKSINLDTKMEEAASEERSHGGSFSINKQSPEKKSIMRMQHQASRFSRFKGLKKASKFSRSLRFIKDPTRRQGSLNQQAE